MSMVLMKRRRRQLAGNFRQKFGAPRDQADAVAVVGKDSRQRPADARRGADHDRLFHLK